MKVLVTGGAGFIGQHVVRMLCERGDTVRVALAPGESDEALAGLPAESVPCDIRRLDAVHDAVRGCDAVIHLAAVYSLWMRDWRPLYQVNVQGTRNVLTACAEHGVSRVVHTSSIAAIGLRDEGPSDEDVPFNLHGNVPHYSLSKLHAERVALEFAEAGLPVVIVNPSFPFGIGDRRPTPTGRMIRRIVRGSFFGAGPGGLNVVDVEDVARGHLFALDGGQVGRRYLLSGTNLDYDEFFAAVKRIAGVERGHMRLPAALLHGMARMGDVVGLFTEPLIDSSTVGYTILRLHFDCSRAQRELGYTVTPLDETLTKAVGWFSDHGMLD